MKPFFRPKRVASAERERKWKETTFLPLPNEYKDDEDDERDFIVDAHEIPVASRMEREGDDGLIAYGNTEVDLPALLECREILSEYKEEAFNQAVLQGMVRRKVPPLSRMTTVRCVDRTCGSLAPIISCFLSRYATVSSASRTMTSIQDTRGRCEYTTASAEPSNGHKWPPTSPRRCTSANPVPRTGSNCCSRV